MPNNSQEQTIYRSLAGRIQLGFYDDGARFPSVQEVAGHYHVSYCPAQRALKALERDGLIRLCRGRETVVLKKPYKNYLDSDAFSARAPSLSALVETLALLSPALSFQGMRRLDPSSLPVFPPMGAGRAQCGQLVYQLFDLTLQALGSRTVLSLYYDIGSFAESSFLDIPYSQLGDEEAGRFLYRLAEDVRRSVRDCRTGGAIAAQERLRAISKRYFSVLKRYFSVLPPPAEPQDFAWEPNKGRTRYCDVVAIDLVCKINQGVYPVGAFLPNSTVLADVYHVSPITIRRTIALLNRLGITETVNGVGSRVAFPGNPSTLRQVDGIMLGDNLRDFLEALQFLAITCEDVLRLSFPHFTPESRQSLTDALALDGQQASRVSAVSACLQAVVRDCPLPPVGEIYGKITLQLLKGSVLRLDETGGEAVPGWHGRNRSLLDALDAGDGGGFAAAFRQLAEDAFTATRTELYKLGVTGLERIADPTG